MLQEALTEILNRLKMLEQKLTNITNLVTNKHTTLSSELTPTETLPELKQRIMDSLNDQWNHQKLPIAYHHLARKYNRDCSKLSTFSQIMTELQTEKRLHLFKNLTGAASFCIPQTIKNTLNPALYQKLCELNLSEKQIKTFHAKQAEMIRLQAQISDRMENAEQKLTELSNETPDEIKPVEISQAELNQMIKESKND